MYKGPASHTVVNDSMTVSNELQSMSKGAVVAECPVHRVSVDRNNLREYHHLNRKLRNYTVRFFEYLRMEIETLLE
jgi:carbohydrate-binding DOMON domain-containing protein